MRGVRMKKLITGITVFVILVPFYMIYLNSSSDQKPHFIDRSKTRPKVVQLERLKPGQKVPVFLPAQQGHAKPGLNSSVKEHAVNLLPGLKPKLPKKDDLGRKHLVEESKQQLLRDELPLLAADWNCRENYSTWQTESYCLPNHSVDSFFITGNKRQCLREGTAHVIRNGSECLCRPHWFGPYCSMPRAVYESEYPRDTYAHLVADPPRRLINAFPFAQEFHLLETRLHEYEGIVDLYVILESNYTAAGHPRKRLLLERFKSGYLKEFHHKILYVPLGFFPKKAYYNGWVADAILRNHISDQGLSRIKNLQESDVIVLNDADELPLREALLFLKLHYGYPEPVGFYLVHNVYGFFWLGADRMSHAFGACSVGMLLHFFHWQLYRLRSATAEMNGNKEDINHFRFIHGGAVSEWSVGNKERMQPGGWHCSWCFTPLGIKTKLEGAHWSDLPRWGAFPSKTTLDYIRNLTVHGLWFDDRTKLLAPPSTRDPWFAPKYLKTHWEEYVHLLEAPDPNAPIVETGDQYIDTSVHKELELAHNQSVKAVDDLVRKLQRNS